MKFREMYQILRYNKSTGMVTLKDRKRGDTFSRPLKNVAEAIKRMK